MLIVLSPAKTLDYETPVPFSDTTQPELLSDARKLVKELKPLAPQDLSQLMGISDKLGQLNYERNQSWKTPFTADNARQAILAFKGDVYTGLAVENFGKRDFNFAQKHIRMLSGLYGVLRPFDLMQPYRLEMGTSLKNSRGDNLYAFWGDKISKSLNKQLAELGGDTLVNLASNEYFKSVDKGALEARIITPVFKDMKNGKYKIISFFAKKARGTMAAWAVKNRVTNADKLKDFDGDGYSYNPDMSSDTEWVFTRSEV